MLDSDFEKLQIIYEEKNLSTAAVRIGISQSALSKILIRLEDKVGQPLFTRTNRGLLATSICQHVYKYSKDQMIRWDAIKGQLKDEQLNGFVRIAGHESVMMSFTKAFDQIFVDLPGADLEFEFVPSVKATQKVLQGEVELALVANPRPHQNLTITTVAKERVAGFQRKKTDKVKTILYNPELIHAHRIVKKTNPERLVSLKNYELIGKIASHSDDSMGILPENVAARHGLEVMSAAPFYEAKLSLVRLRSQANTPLLKRVIQIIKNNGGDL